MQHCRLTEAGLALACRQPSEVLLIRDDRDNFLFDVSAIPHKIIDFSDKNRARHELHVEIRDQRAERSAVDL